MAAERRGVQTHNLRDHSLHDVFILQIVEEAGGRGAGEKAQLGDVGGLIGCAGDAQGEEFDALVFGVGDSGEDVWIPGMGNSICEQHGHSDAARAGLLQVDLGHVGDGVSGVGAVPDVDDGGYTSLEVFRAPPVLEGGLRDDVAAVLQQSHPQGQAVACAQSCPLEPVHHFCDKLLLLLMVVLCALRAVQQKGELQATLL